MSDEKTTEKTKFTKELIEKQLNDTKQSIENLKGQIQQLIGIMNYLNAVKDSFEFIQDDKKDAGKPILEIR